MKITRLIACAAMLFAALPLNALSIDRSAIKNARTFGIEFPDGTSYYGLASSVSGISKQQYTVGPILVNEITIDVSGASTQVRIYHAQLIDSRMVDAAASKLPKELQPYAAIPDNLREQMKKADDRAADLSASKVTKDYPVTTHAHTIEFVIEDISEFEVFYDTIVSDYTGKDRKFQSPQVEDTSTEPGLVGKIYRISPKAQKK